jgi:PIN domain-containing protein
MRIVLDTTAFRKDFSLNSPDMRLLREYLNRTGSNLFVPAIVLDEIKNSHRESLEKTKFSLLADLRQLLAWSNLTLPDIDVEGESDRYIETLTRRLQLQYRARFLPYPDISHNVLVSRDLARRKPFSESGRGYRDALIWYSIFPLLDSETTELAFVTANAKDFWNSDKTGLHPDLSADLPGGIQPRGFHLFQGIEAFNSAITKPKLQLLKDVQESLQNRTHTMLDLYRTLEEHTAELKGTINDETINNLAREALGYLFPGIGSFSIEKFEGPEEIKVSAVLEIEGSKLFVSFDAYYDLVFTTGVPTEDVPRWKRSGVTLFEPEIMGDLAEIDVELCAGFKIALIFDPLKIAVEDFAITETYLFPY